jgi:hypothetical protein
VSAAPDHGSVAEEAARLFEVLQDAASTWSRGAAGSEHHGDPGHGDPDHGDPGHGQTPAACRVCPLCQLVAAVQNVRPETVQHLADAAASLAAAFSDLVSGMAGPAGAGHEHRRDSHRARPDDVQHIDISD